MLNVTKSHCIFIFLAILTLGMSLGLPAEDVLDSVYDESESVPFEVNSQSRTVEEQRRADEPQAVTMRVSAPSCRCVDAGRECQHQQSNSPLHPAHNSLIIVKHSLRC